MLQALLLGMVHVAPAPPADPPISAVCQAKLNAFCNDAKLNGPNCLEPTTKWYPDASPWVGIVGPSCAGMKCEGHNCTCTGPAPGSFCLRCYSHLALVDGKWSAKAPHPNALCGSTDPGLVKIYKECTGHTPPKPPPSPPPAGYANATVTLVPVMVAGAKAVGCTSPPQAPATEACVYKAFRIPGFVNAGGTLLAFAEGRATGCGDFSGYHDMMKVSSTDMGKTVSSLACCLFEPQHDACFFACSQWGQLTTIVDARALWKGFTATHGLAVWDPTPLYDNSTGETFLFFGGPGRTKGHHWSAPAYSPRPAQNSTVLIVRPYYAYGLWLAHARF